MREKMQFKMNSDKMLEMLEAIVWKGNRADIS